MKTMVMKRKGEHEKRIPMCEVRADGSCWHRNMYPMIDAKSPAAISFGLDKIQDLMKKNQASKIPAECLAKIGISESGLEVVEAAEYDKRNAPVVVPLTEAQNARRKISNMFDHAEARLRDNDDCNTMDHYRMMAEARNALAAWREKYPAEANKEKADALRREAANIRRLAAGALLYDCDGSLSAADQQHRHDEMMIEARGIEAQANEIEGK